MPPARNTEPTAEPAGTAREKKDLGPRPAHILLEAISDALGAGVDREKIQTLVDMARMAKGVQQAPVWKMVAETLTGYVAEAKPKDS